MNKTLIIAALAAAVICPAKAVASDIERGDAAVAYVGPYDEPKVGSESMGAVIPFDTRMEHNYCQTLYTADMLTGLNQVIDGKASKSEISAITFKMIDRCGAMPVGQKFFKVYVQNTDATTFPSVNNEKQWFTVDTSIEGTGETEDYYYYPENDLEYTITLSTPLVYEGKSLLITWITDGLIEDGIGGYFDSQVFQASDGQTHSAIRAEDYSIGMQSGNLTNSSKDLPVLKIDYTPLFEETGQLPVTFENVEVKLEAVGLPSGFYSSANAITITFDLNDPTNGEEYEIFMGTQSLGTISSTSGTIRFLAEPKSDVVLRVEPASDDALATSYTISAADFAALFPAPGATFTGSYALYSEYDLFNDMGGELQGAAQFQMTSTAPVARMWADAESPANVEQMYRGGTEYPDNLMALVPRNANANNAGDLHKTGGILAVYSPYLGNGRLKGDEMVWPEQVSITVKLFCMYPLVSQAVPTLTAGKAAFDADDQVYGTVTTIQRDADNGDGWKKSSFTARMPVDALHFKQDVTYPDRLRVKQDAYHGTLQFYAPNGLQIQHKFEPTASRADEAEADEEQPEWTAAATNPWTYNTKESAVGTLNVRTVNPKNGEVYHQMVFYIGEDGGFMSALEAINTSAAEKAQCYDLMGRRLAAPTRGLNIINGRKVIR